MQIQSLLSAFAAVFMLLPTSAVAQVEVEIDPIAYALHGYSIHVGYAIDHQKIDVGSFGLETPKSFESDANFTTSFPWGVGAKYHYFLKSGRSGWFAGVGAGYSRLKALNTISGHDARATEFSAGPEVGYRFTFGTGAFYLTPWIGFDHTFTGSRVSVDGRTYEEKPIRPFPAVHLGWRF